MSLPIGLGADAGPRIGGGVEREERPDPVQSFYARRESAHPSGDPIRGLDGPELFAEVRRRAGSPLRARWGPAVLPWAMTLDLANESDGASPLLFVIAAAAILSYYVYMWRAGLLGMLTSRPYGIVHGWVLGASSDEDLASTRWERAASLSMAVGFIGLLLTAVVVSAG